MRFIFHTGNSQERIIFARTFAETHNRKQLELQCRRCTNARIFDTLELWSIEAFICDQSFGELQSTICVRIRPECILTGEYQQRIILSRLTALWSRRKDVVDCMCFYFHKCKCDRVNTKPRSNSRTLYFRPYALYFSRNLQHKKLKTKNVFYFHRFRLQNFGRQSVPRPTEAYIRVDCVFLFSQNKASITATGRRSRYSLVLTDQRRLIFSRTLVDYMRIIFHGIGHYKPTSDSRTLYFQPKVAPLADITNTTASR